MTTFGKDGKGEKGAGGVQSASKKMLLSEEEREIVCWATNFKTFLSSPSFKCSDGSQKALLEFPDMRSGMLGVGAGLASTAAAKIFCFNVCQNLRCR